MGKIFYINIHVFGGRTSNSPWPCLVLSCVKYQILYHKSLPPCSNRGCWMAVRDQLGTVLVFLLTYSLESDLNSRIPYRKTLRLFDETFVQNCLLLGYFFRSSLIKLFYITFIFNYLFIYYHRYQFGKLITLQGQKKKG